MAGLAALAPSVGSAQETTPAAYSLPTITEEMKATEHQELQAARAAATAHARSCENCIGVVFHEGDDLRARVHRDAIAYLEKRNFPLTEGNIAKANDQVMEAYVQHYADQIQALFRNVGVDAQVFSRVDYGTDTAAVGTGVNFHIGRIIYHDASDNDRTSFFISDIDAKMAVNVVEALNTVWENDPELHVGLLDNAPSASPEG